MTEPAWTDAARTEPVTSLILVTGHSFGMRAFEGIFSSVPYLEGRLEVPLMIGLDDAHAPATVGYQAAGHLAAEQGVPYVATADGRLTSLAGQLGAAAPDYLLVIGWSRLIPAEILALPGAGCIGMHPTRLPEGRGQAPIPWTIIKGCKRTALSVFFLAAGADTGPVIAQYELDVAARETGASLFYRMAHAHFTAGLELADGLAIRQVAARAQDESAASRWPKRRPGDGEILPSMTCAQIDALVRALLGPYPRAFLGSAAGRQYIRRVEKSDAAGRIRFPCSDGMVYLVTDQAYRPG